MKKRNLTAVLGLAAAFVFLGVPLKADNYSVIGLHLAKAAKAGGFSTLTLEPFGNHDGARPADVRYAEKELTLGLIKEKDLELLSRGQLKGVDCSNKGWFSEAPPKICPQAVIKGSVFKTSEGLSLMVWLIDTSDDRVIKTMETRFEEKLPEISNPTAKPGDFRDAPGALKADYAAPLQISNKINEGAVGLKARYRAAGIEKPGFSCPNSAVNFEKRTFKLVKKPDPALEASLEGILSASYNSAVKNYTGNGPMAIGFTYSLAPRGAVYPFSEIEVSCIMQEIYARSTGPKICGDFFRELDVKIKRALPVLLAMI
ncbi:MAG: hypothetical protein A2X34_03500 [Elusimicrobia bacterium GWC2_51_8]|nr:MAG: hypothetical protein A2X33_11225 [Elusimicrobia bacterium GWA2_51_34]OGR65265.1 MAG: hypothetical protein A2X34_03500 [Elusimicrobia bacterium GWC2_51_8]OGR85017.1 MAG: hypothetical protein A2021_08550 [Elusimicrobia bacterium GWF2_52_66]HCE98592.1 hypothetical protein [Elusimicrobiota bacterium]